MESFRALKLTLLESFRALKFVKSYWRFRNTAFYSPFWRDLGPYPPKTHLESFMVLIVTLLESFRALMLMIVANCLPNPRGGPKAKDGHHKSA